MPRPSARTAMRLRHALLALCCLLLAGTARAQTYVEFFELPGDPSLHGLDYHDGSLWVSVRSSSEPRILQLDPDDGSVVSTISLSVVPVGVTWDGAAFWVSERSTSTPELFRVGTDGTVLDQIPAPSQLSNGLAWRDDTLWVANAFPDAGASLVGVDPADGSALGEIPFPSTQPAGIAFLGDGTLWTTNVGDDSGSDLEVLWKLDRAGNVLDTLEVPTGAGRPRGLAYDGSRFLYAVMDEPGGFDDVVYKIDLSTEGTPVYADNADVIDFGLGRIDLVNIRFLNIENEGDASLTISDVAVTGPGADAFIVPLEDTTLTPGASLQVSVGFQADGYGPREATLSFATNDVANTTVAIPLRGVGVFPEPQLGFAEGGHDFGEVRIEDPYGGGRSERLWTLQMINQGVGDLTAGGYDLMGDSAFFVLNENDFPVDIATADTVKVLVGFRPPAVGDFAADLIVFSTADPFIAALSGEGIDPDIEGGDALWTYALPDNPATSFQDKKISTLKSPGDVTGDGKADLVLGSENYLVLALNGNGWGTADTLWSFNTCYNNFDCGSVAGNLGIFETGLAAGADFNQDGTGDVVFAVDGGGDRVTALSGRDGQIIWSLDTPDDPFLASYNAVAVRFDVTGDGVPDVATCTGTASDQSPNPFNERRVYLLDGATGDELWQATPGLPNFVVEQFERADGQPLVAAGGRGENDVAHVTAYDAATGSVAWRIAPQIAPFVMAPYPRSGGGEDLVYAGLGDSFGGGGLARVDGATGDEVWSSYAFGTSVWDVAVLGDVNADGAPDLALGSVLADAYVLDGATGAVLWSAPLGGQVFDVAAVDDVDGDGLSEVAATGGDGRAVLLSGADGAALWSYRIGNGSLGQSGEVIVAVPDLDGNGFPEISAATRHGHVALIASSGDFVTGTDDAAAPAAFALAQNFPNPFRAGTTLRYALAEPADVRLTVYNLLGQRVRTLVGERQPAGVYTVPWDGHGASGAPAASGVYLARLEAGAFAQTRRLVLVR